MSKIKELSFESLNNLINIKDLRVNADLRERHLYEYDVTELPSMLKALAGDTTPGVIVQPQTEEDIKAVVEWANKFQIPLIPRAAATSGYGGVVPVKGSAVVELIHFNKIIKIDKEKLSVTVEPGVVWKDLELELAPYGLAPRMVPTSAPGSTVGGWLAQGGTGFGGYQYGWIEQNVQSVTVICPDGTKRTLNEKELVLVGGAMGTTGIITSVTLSLRTYEKEFVVGVEADSASKIQYILQQVNKKELPLWHAGFTNPTASGIKNKILQKDHHGNTDGEPVLPESYILLLACMESRSEDVLEKLKPIIKESGAKILPQNITDHKWEERFKPMKMRRIGPSIVSAEVVIPFSGVSRIIGQIDKLIKAPVIMEATVVKGNEVVLLCLIPHDARKFSFNFAYTLSLSILRIVKRNGGRAYASGLFLAQEARAVHGMRLKLWQDYKAKKDVLDKFNPRKISGIKSMTRFIRTTLWLEPIVRLMGNSIKPKFQPLDEVNSQKLTKLKPKNLKI